MVTKSLKKIANNAKEVLITGAVDDCCVMSTIYSGIDYGDNLIILKDAIGEIHDDGDKFLEYVGANFSNIHLNI